MKRKYIFTYPWWIRWLFIGMPTLFAIGWSLPLLLTPHDQMTIEEVNTHAAGVILGPIFVALMAAFAWVFDGERFILRSHSLWYRGRFGRRRICYDDITGVRFLGWPYLGGFVTIKSAHGKIEFGMGIRAADHLLWQLHRRLIKAGLSDLLATKGYVRARRSGEIARCMLMFCRRWRRGSLLLAVGVLLGSVLVGLAVPIPSTVVPWLQRAMAVAIALQIAVILVFLFGIVGHVIAIRACVRAAKPQALRLPCGQITAQKDRVIRLRRWTLASALLLIVVPAVVLFFLWGPRARAIRNLQDAGAVVEVMPPFMTDEYNSVDITSDVKDPTLLPPLAPLSPLDSVGVASANITDDDLGRILTGTDMYRLYIWETPLKGSFLSSLDSAKTMGTLVIRRTACEDRHLAHLKKLPELRTLLFSESPIGDEGLRHIGAVSQLEILHLTGTKITGSGLAHLKGLAGLELLLLDDTDVSDEGLAHLAGLTRLVNLSLRKTAIASGGLIHLKDLVRLKTLNLKEAGVTDDGLRHLAGLYALESLYLSDCAIDGSGFQHLGSLTELATLELINTQILDEHLRHVGTLLGLTQLNLHGAPITGDGLRHLRPLDQLWQLNLGQTGIRDEHLAHLTGLKNLTSLSLIGTQVTDDCINILIQMEELSSVYLEDTKVTEAGYDRLREERPMLWTEHNQPRWGSYGPLGGYGLPGGGYGYFGPSQPYNP